MSTINLRYRLHQHNPCYRHLLAFHQPDVSRRLHDLNIGLGRNLTYGTGIFKTFWGRYHADKASYIIASYRVEAFKDVLHEMLSAYSSTYLFGIVISIQSLADLGERSCSPLKTRERAGAS